MRGVTPGKAALHAGVAFVGLTVLVRHHAHDFVTLHLRLERATHAAIGAGGDLGVLGLAEMDDRLFLQRRGRASGHTGAARHALGVHERLVLSGRDTRFEAAPRDRQRECALRFLAGAHAAVADDALRGVVGEVGVRLVFLAVEVIFAVEAVTHFAQARHAGHVLQFAVAIGGAGQAVERVIGDVQLHHALAQFLELR